MNGIFVNCDTPVSLLGVHLHCAVTLAVHFQGFNCITGVRLGHLQPKCHICLNHFLQTLADP